MREKTILLPLFLALAVLCGCGKGETEPEPTPTAEPTATPEPTAAADMALTVVWNDSAYDGLYTGGLKNMQPEGEGRFEGKNAAQERFVWDGGWRAGVPSGAGSMTLDGFAATLEDEPAAGTYTGEAVSGAPEGEGEFSSADAEGVPYTYTGHWSGGKMNGQGTLTYAAENRLVRTGTFTDGEFTPTWLEALETIGTGEPAFRFTQAQLDFIGQYPALWEADNYRNYMKSDYKKIYDRSLILRKCFEKPELLDEPRWMGMSAVRIVRSWTVTLGEHSFTCITGADGTYTYPMRVIIPEAIEGLRRGQRFHVYGIPITLSEYTTVLGEKQNCLVLLAGDVYIATK